MTPNKRKFGFLALILLCICMIVGVQASEVTLTASGDRSYYFGEEIILSGANTDSNSTYLFMTGPNLYQQGVSLTPLNPPIGVTNDQATTFTSVLVKNDDTYEYIWDTVESQLDAGIYTLYAASLPKDTNNLADCEYDTVRIYLNKPYVFASIFEDDVGESVFIRGRATGNPSAIAIWMFGSDYYQRTDVQVTGDTYFEFQLTCDTAQHIANEQCFIVVQHPMCNNQFDVEEVFVGGNTYATVRGVVPVVGEASNDYFPVDGSGFHLTGSDAANALIQLIQKAYVHAHSKLHRGLIRF